MIADIVTFIIEMRVMVGCLPYSPTKFFYLCFFSGAFIMMSGFANAQQKQDDVKENRFSISIMPAYQQENFRWSIAGDIRGANPNIYSELIWKKIAGPAISADITWKFWKSFLIKSNFLKTFIRSGNVTDTDYQGDNRTDKSYYGSFNAGHGDIISIQALLGYKFLIKKKNFITLYFGYRIHAQSLFLLNQSTYPGLKSSYATSWKGIAGGFHAEIFVAKKISIEPSFLYSQVKYSGKANWNLIQQFQHPLSFEDRANGFGIEPGIKLRYNFDTTFSIFFSGNYSYWKTGKGIDQLYLANGQTPSTQFNGACGNSWEMGVGVRLLF